MVSSATGSTPSAVMTVRISGSASSDEIVGSVSYMTVLFSLEHCDRSSGQRRIIDEALLFAGIEGRAVRCIERSPGPIARRQIGVCQERHAERDQIGLAGGDCCLRGGLAEAAIDDVGAVELRPQHPRDALRSIRRRID